MIGRVRDNPSSPALTLPCNPVPPPVPHTSLVWVASRYPYGPRTTPKDPLPWHLRLDVLTASRGECVGVGQHVVTVATFSLPSDSAEE